MDKSKLQFLLRQYFNDTLSDQDRAELLGYLDQAGVDQVEDLITEDLLDLEQGPEFERSKEVFAQIISDERYQQHKLVEPEVRVVPLYRKVWFRVAVAVVVVASAALLVFKPTAKQNQTDKNQPSYAGVLIVPGGKKAVLTTGNGKQIVLDSLANGVLAQSGNSKVVKLKTGKIAYENSNGTAAATEYNTLTTPKGGEYQVVLADGTKVWLNAASSITYPTHFTGKSREVKLTGEAYFEVAKNPDQPFYVNTPNTTVRVLGTHFNVSAYADDDVTATTLLEGSVEITKDAAKAMIKPGQQARMAQQGKQFQVSQADITEVMAWKNGYFIFDDDNIDGIMKKVARWYDVSITYQGNFDDTRFGGTFHRSKSIDDLLNYLGKIGGVHFMVKERRVTVMK